MEPITVTAARPDPKWPGTYVRSSGKYYWNSGANWHKYIPEGDGEGDWEPTDDPTIMVQAGGDLSTGAFITSDRNHYVQAECEINIIRWDGVGVGSGSGDIDFTNDGNSPKIIMYPQSAENGRTYAIAYSVTGRVGDVSDNVSFAQNDLAMLRQEYVDKRTNSTPASGEFDTSSPAYQNTPRWGLLNNRDYDYDAHTHRILDTINANARKVDEKYTDGVPYYTAGYACPVDNDHLPNSKHIYGKAIDFDEGADDSETASHKNYKVYQAATAAGFRTYLYDSAEKWYTNLPAYPTKPTGFAGSYYIKGHIEW